MYWTDEGYLLSKNNFDENSIIMEVFTSKHGKYTGIVYGGSSKKNKKIFQIGNKIFINYKSKSENRTGYFTVELIKAITPVFFDDKKRSITILSASSILKILLPERQLNKNIYDSFEKFISNLYSDNWINHYILWELSLIKELGFEINLSKDQMNESKNNTIEINSKNFKIPKLLLNKQITNSSNSEIVEALNFNKNLLMENFVLPNRIRFPISRNLLEKYFN